jgi:hypothetical protein
MKRSEMVERLKCFFVDEDWCNEADDDFATEIIDFLKQQGMQPPAYEKFVDSGCVFGITEEKIYLKRQVNEWEDEQ